MREFIRSLQEKVTGYFEAVIRLLEIKALTLIKLVFIVINMSEKV